MSTEKLELETLLPASADEVYHAWLDSKSHSSFTGAEAHIQPQEGAEFSAWDEYITGRIIALERDKRILQSWRTTEFPDSAEDSILEVMFDNTQEGCRLLINHWKIPKGQGDRYRDGWEEYYFKPMKEYFSKK
jgi:activator of HSP90 ATPase